MRVLFISSSPMRRDNTIGNTYANLFEGMDDMTFASIYCKGGVPDVEYISDHFRVTEKDIIKSLKHKSVPAGKRIAPQKGDSVTYSKAYDLARILRFKPIFWLRDLVWKIGKWRSKELNAFIDEVKPDIVFAPLIDNRALNGIIRYVHGYAGCKLVLYAWDDVYTLDQFSFSPMFWLDRFYQRPSMRKTVDECDKLYVISEMQKKASKYIRSCMIRA